MKRLLLTIALLPAFSSVSAADPMRTERFGAVPERTRCPAQEECVISYYNICSGWVWSWMGYCDAPFSENLPVQYGVKFDLHDCHVGCQSHYETWWAIDRLSQYGRVDVELFCSWPVGCPAGRPVLAVYGFVPDMATPWQLFSPNQCLGECTDLGGGFVLLITDYTAGVHTAPYSDHPAKNAAAGCQDWRCTGHSFIYKNAVDYCSWYGMPAPLWVAGPGYGCTNVPSIPVGCHDYSYPTGAFAEFLMESHLFCLGATATEDDRWSEIKEMYR